MIQLTELWYKDVWPAASSWGFVTLTVKSVAVISWRKTWSISSPEGLIREAVELCRKHSTHLIKTAFKSNISHKKLSVWFLSDVSIVSIRLPVITVKKRVKIETSTSNSARRLNPYRKETTQKTHCSKCFHLWCFVFWNLWKTGFCSSEKQIWNNLLKKHQRNNMNPTRFHRWFEVNKLSCVESPEGAL